MGKEHVLRVISELHDMTNLTMEYSVAKMGQTTELEKWVNQKMVAFDPSKNDLNCYEIILYAALMAGVLDPSEIAEIYKSATEAAKKVSMGFKPRAYATTFMKSVTHGDLKTYDLFTHSPRPAPGDLVFFGDANFRAGIMHAAVATGDLIQGSMIPTRAGTIVEYDKGMAKVNPDPEGLHTLESIVFSFWPRYGIQIVDGKFRKTVPGSLDHTRVEVTTIEDLVLGMAREIDDVDTIDISRYKVVFASPVWSRF